MSFKVEYINKLKITITTILVILVGLFAYLFQDLFNNLENKLIDARSYLSTDKGLFSARFKHADKNIVILSINDLTLYEAANSNELNLTNWPWSRAIWAKVINFLERQKPKAIIIDLNFSNYEDLAQIYSSADMQLADALGYYNNTILSTALKTSFKDTQKTKTTKLLQTFENPYTPSNDDLNVNIKNPQIEKNISYYAHTPIPNIFTNSTTIGVTNLVVSENRDENIRYSQPLYKLIKGNKDYYIPSIGLAALLKTQFNEQPIEPIKIENNLLKIGKYTIRLNNNGQALINWHSHGNSYEDIPINAILLSMVRGSNEFEYLKESKPLSYFKDKIILITQTQTNTETHNTPIAKSLTDAQTKATIIDNYINDADTTNKYKRGFLKNITTYKGTIITVSFCLVMIISMLIATSIPLAFVNGTLLTIGYIVLSIYLFCNPKYRIILDMALPLYFILWSFAIAFTMKAHHEFKKKKKIEKTFGNLVSEKVLKQLVTKPHRLNMKSSIQKITVMSCNLSNNLLISQDLSPEKYVELINNVFNAIEKIIFKYNGTINRFIGNTVLVYWGYPIQSRKDAQNAINAAFEIIQKIDEFNTSIQNLRFEDYDEQNFEEQNPSKHAFNVKIAINTGNALIGRIGSSQISDFTVLGEQVDVVERIESICNEFGKTIIVTENTIKEIDSEPNVTYMGQVKLKDSKEKIKIFELSSHNNRQNQWFT